MKIDDDPFDVESLRLAPVQVHQARPRSPRKIAKRRQHFIMFPFDWLERLNGAHGMTYAVALHLQYLQWKGKGAPIKLPNGMLKVDGISRHSKWRALGELERRGLISIKRRPKKSPLISVTTNKPQS